MSKPTEGHGADGASPEASGSGGVRADHVALTREKVLRAVNELLATQHPASLSVPAVARQAGVSVPTIYRHFGTKEGLLEASARSVDQRTRQWLGGDAIVPGKNLGPFMAEMWSELAQDLATLRSSHFSPVGHELRSRRGARRLADAERGLSEAGVDVTSEAGQRLVRVVLVFTSSSILLEQVGRLGLAPELGASDVTWAIETLTSAVVGADSAAKRSAATRPAVKRTAAKGASARRRAPT